MRYVRSIFFLLLPFFLFSLQGCGSSSSSGAFNPTSSATGGGAGGGTSTTPIGTTEAPVFSLKLATDVSAVDANNGTVLAKATLISLTSGTTLNPATGQQADLVQGAQVPNWPVTFTILAGPATLTPPSLPTRSDPNTINTDSNGLAVMPITSGNTPITTNVLVQASTVISGQTVTAVTSFQIVRGTGIINFPGTPISSEKTVPPDPGVGSWIFFQQIPFTVTDSNGNPRVGVPVTLSVYSHASNALVPSIITIDYLQNPVTEPNQQTVTTDSQGKGVFNVSVQAFMPGPGFNTIDSIVFKAVTNDANPLVSYAGLITNLIESVSPLVIVPQTANFAATDVAGATISFTISGGALPYQVTSSNPGRVSVVLQPDGVTAIATLQDASLWTGSVSISATDQKGQTATATVLRQ